MTRAGDWLRKVDPMEDADVAAIHERINRLCDNIAGGADECANPDHLIRIVGALECVFMSGHDDIDYEDDGEERRPDA